MNPLWDYFWPVFEAGLIIGAVALGIGINRTRRNLVLTVGLGAAIAVAALWHGPGGAAERFGGRVERSARQALDHYEMTTITGRLDRRPLTRELVLAGPADDFQRAELVRLFSQLPGVSGASWNAGFGRLPLLAEAAGVALLGFLIGAVLAFLVELRRRYNAQWKW